jgi:hypothetical protein
MSQDFIFRSNKTRKLKVKVYVPSARFIDNAKLRAHDYERLEFEASENVFYLMVQVAF